MKHLGTYDFAEEGAKDTYTLHVLLVETDDRYIIEVDPQETEGTVIADADVVVDDLDSVHDLAAYWECIREDLLEYMLDDVGNDLLDESKI